MDPLTSFITEVGAIFVLLSDLALGLLLLGFVFEGRKIADRVPQFLRVYSVHIAFALALSAALLSLYYSDIAGFIPCKLCWFQRISMYSLVVVLGVGMYFKERSVYWSGLILAVLGSVVALYHHIIQIVPSASVLPCALPTSMEPSCTQVLFIEYGYVTFPMFALTVFLLIIVLLFLYKKELSR